MYKILVSKSRHLKVTLIAELLHEGLKSASGKGLIALQSVPEKASTTKGADKDVFVKLRSIDTTPGEAGITNQTDASEPAHWLATS